MRLNRSTASAWVTRLRTQLFSLIPQLVSHRTILFIDPKWLKLVHAKTGRPVQTIMFVSACPVEDLSDGAILQQLRRMCESGGIQPDRVVVAHPTQLSTTRLFTLPSIDPQEIREIIDLQIEKQTPYAQDEVVTDLLILDSTAEGYSNVLLLIAHQDPIHRAVRLAHAMGWAVEQVVSELEGLAHWIHLVRGDASSSRGTMVIDLEGHCATFMIEYKGKPYFQRSLPMSVQQLTHSPQTEITRLVTDIQRSLEAFDAEGIKFTVKEGILTGRTEFFKAFQETLFLQGLQESLQSRLNIPISQIPLFQGCELSKRALRAVQELPQSSFTGLLGLLKKPAVLNLTPKAMKLQRAFETRARMLIGIGYQLLAILVLISFLGISQVHKSERYHAWLLQEYRQTQREAEQLEGLLGQLSVVKDWHSARGTLLNAMATLNQQSPSVVTWQSLSYTKGAQMIVRGVSQEMPKVFEYAGATQQTPLFSHVEARRVTKRKEGERDITDFELVCSLGSAAEEPVE